MSHEKNRHALRIGDTVILRGTVRAVDEAGNVDVALPCVPPDPDARIISVHATQLETENPAKPAAEDRKHIQARPRKRR